MLFFFVLLYFFFFNLQGRLFLIVRYTLRKIPQFHLISWCEILWKDTVFARNYAETVPFHRISTP